MYVFTKIGSSFEKTQVPLESVLSVLLFVLPCGLSAQETISLDGEWSFWTPDHPQATVNVPHAFNVMDGLESYAGKAFYSTLPDIPAEIDGEIWGVLAVTFVVKMLR